MKTMVKQLEQDLGYLKKLMDTVTEDDLSPAFKEDPLGCAVPFMSISQAIEVFGVFSLPRILWIKATKKDHSF